MDSIDIAELGQASENADDRERSQRLRRLLIILLLLLLLLFGIILAFLTLFGNLFDREERPGINMLFSLFGFDRPLAVSTDKKGRIIVSDTGNSRVVIFDSTGQYMRTIRGKKKADRFYGAIGTYYDDKDRRLYVAEYRRRQVSVFNAQGKRIDRFPDDPGNQRKYGVLAFSPFGLDMYKNKLYVTSNDGIYVFSKKGKLLKQWSGNGSDIGQFDYPIALEIGKDGTMFVADQLNRRVVAMTQKGVVKWALGRADDQGKASSFFGLPRGLALDPAGRLFVSDTFHHELIVLSQEGKLLGTLSDRGVEDARLNFPEEISFRPDGALYLADRENDRIQAWRINQIQKPNKRLLKRHKKYFYKVKG